ncbi:MAG TPA: hypothetical protein VHZ95_20990, partial [Polyangiales bacterium]|nr:hypothetical protein [Polyangiales bacterium]
TMHLGPNQILLNLVVDFKDALSASEIEHAVQRLETAIRAKHADVSRIFIEAASLKRRERPRADGATRRVGT